MFLLPRRQAVLKCWKGCRLTSVLYTLCPSIIISIATKDCFNRAVCGTHLTSHFVYLSKCSCRQQIFVVWLQIFVCFHVNLWQLNSGLTATVPVESHHWSGPKFPIKPSNADGRKKADPWNYKISSLLLHSLSFIASYLVPSSLCCDLTLCWCRPNGGLGDERSDWWEGGERGK